MDIRVLKYFLTVAQEGNITKAAESLHITQPTLSRQLIDLEAELGTSLLIRGKRQITLTESGLLFQQRIQVILSLLEKAEGEISDHGNLVGGVISVGCVESMASLILPEAMAAFAEKYPRVQYDIYTADGDDIRDKLDAGTIDIGILVEPIETAKYDFIRLPIMESWGVLMRGDDSLATKTSMDVADILQLPLILPRRAIVRDEIAGWLGVENKQLNLVATINLLTNAALLVEKGLGYLVCIGGAYWIRPNEKTCFIPFLPERTTGHVVAWKKNRVFSTAMKLFMEQIRGMYPDKSI